MSFAIRATRASDARALPAIERAAAGAFLGWDDLAWLADGETMSVNRHMSLLLEGTHWVATDAQNRLLGFVATEREAGALHVCEMSVHPDEQRRGIGAALLRAAIAHAEDCGLPTVTLTTFRDIPWNAPFYARMGFRMLERNRMGHRLATILRREAEHGLPVKRRCAMRYTVLAPAFAGG